MTVVSSASMHTCPGTASGSSDGAAFVTVSMSSTSRIRRSVNACCRMAVRVRRDASCMAASFSSENSAPSCGSSNKARSVYQSFSSRIISCFWGSVTTPSGSSTRPDTEVVKPSSTGGSSCPDGSGAVTVSPGTGTSMFSFSA